MSEKSTQTKTQTGTKVQARPGDELVDYTAPLLPGQEKQDIVVGVNGEMVRIKRGETVKLKRKHVSAINDAARQQVAAYKAAAEAQQTKKLYDL